MKSIPITRFFPNIVTFFGICAGLTSIKCSFGHKWEMAVIFIILAAIIDGIDGRLARILDSTSQFGAELDSLADLISFGVAPAFLLYFWQLFEIKVFGWALTMAFVLCMAIRLARFNADLIQNKDSAIRFLSKHFFSGVPAPLGAILVVLPVILNFHHCEYLSFVKNNFILLIYIISIAILIVSKLPTFSLKHIKIPDYLDSIVVFVFAIVVILLITKPWTTIPMLSSLYLASIPVSCIYYSSMYRRVIKSDIPNSESDNS